MVDPLHATCATLTRGAAAFAGLPAASRARLAGDTARAVAASADAWVDAAVAIKSRHESGERFATAATAMLLAEEAATGPMATLRLLLITARALDDVARRGVPRPALAPRVLPAAGPDGTGFVAVGLLPVPGLHDPAIFHGVTATARCVNPGGVEAFMRSWREEAADRPRAGGVTLVLGAGNVTGLAAADCISQVFEHGRAVLLKLHPLHEPLRSVMREALRPLVEAGLLEVVSGGVETARSGIAAPAVTHVHLTGGRNAFDALVWGGGDAAAGATPVLDKPISCELGNVTPWIVVPGRYTPRQLRFQADTVAASIANNTSYNCIATKCLVTCRSWSQREDFLGIVAARLACLPARPAWYPGSTAAWEAASGRAAPGDGTLPWVFRTGVDRTREPHWLEREWFAPIAVETPLEADGIDAFCGVARSFTRGLPGTLAASVTVPEALSAQERQRVEQLVDHLAYGVVAVNSWSAFAYALGNVPWGGYPGGTLADPGSGIGRVHDPMLLPLVHNSVLRAPLQSRLTPPWFPWHSQGPRLARGVLAMYAARARGSSGLWELASMLPAVLGE